MYFHRISTPGLAINSYLIGDDKKCVVIDPTRLVAQYILHAENAELTITDIVETHVHADFVSGSKELKHQLGGKPVIHASGMGGGEWIPTYADHIVYDGDAITLGTIRLVALHTPGHTPEHLSWVVYDDSRSKTHPWFVFSGDLLFVGGVGRPDLLGEKEKKKLADHLYTSLFVKMKALPDFVEILPGHSAGSLCGNHLHGFSSSTLGFERQCNPYLVPMQKNQWIKKVVNEKIPIPPYFSRLKEVNIEGPALLEELHTGPVTEKTMKSREKIFWVDVRHPEKFAKGHFREAINIPFLSSFTNWAGWLVKPDLPIGLVVDEERKIGDVVDQLRLIGFDQQIWTYLWDEKKLKGKHLETIDYLSVADFHQRQRDDQNLCILDVRTQEEWDKGHIPDAVHIELNELYDKMHTLPTDAYIVVHCRSGYRGSTGASLLKKFGYGQVANLKGGYKAWKN